MASLHRPSQPEPGEGAAPWRPLRPLALRQDEDGTHLFTKEQVPVVLAHIVDEDPHRRPLRRHDNSCTGGGFKDPTFKGPRAPRTPAGWVFRCINFGPKTCQAHVKFTNRNRALKNNTACDDWWVVRNVPHGDSCLLVSGNELPATRTNANSVVVSPTLPSPTLPHCSPPSSATPVTTLTVHPTLSCPFPLPTDEERDLGRVPRSARRHATL